MGIYYQNIAIFILLKMENTPHLGPLRPQNP